MHFSTVSHIAFKLSTVTQKVDLEYDFVILHIVYYIIIILHQLLLNITHWPFKSLQSSGLERDNK